MEIIIMVPNMKIKININCSPNYNKEDLFCVFLSTMLLKQILKFCLVII